MNELVLRNAITIPSGSIAIPFERMFGQKKQGFGSSSVRMNALSPPQILAMLKDKFSNVNISKTETMSSFSTATSQAPQPQKRYEPSHMRLHVPIHKNYIAQLVKDIDQGQKRGRAFSTNDAQSDKTIKQIRKGPSKKVTQNDNERQPFVAISEQNKEYLKEMYSMTEDLITPQQKRSKNSQKYKQTHRSCFMGTAREKSEDLLIKNKFLPGPGDYRIPRMFEKVSDDKTSSRKLRNFSTSNFPLQSGIVESDELIYENVEPYIDDEKQLKMEQERRLVLGQIEHQKRQIFKVKEKLEKTLAATSDQSEAVNLQQYNSDTTNAALPSYKNNQSYMFTKDDRDRFGEQVFPLAGTVKVPGPGMYDQDYYSLSKKVQVIQSQEEQKKLLKIWLHPMKDEAKTSTTKVASNANSLQFDPNGLIHLKHY